MAKDINQVMQEHNCTTLEELEEKRLKLCSNVKTLESMIDDNWRRDFEYAQKVGIERDKCATQVSEIEEAREGN